MSLYTKYRPRDWDSVVSQDYITTILRNSLKSDRVGHAYLFHGSRGTGKTTSARILAKGVNCTNLRDGNPCHECENCRAFDNGTMLDCIEIDGASNNGVENVRDLIEKARFEPNQGKYKVYIIDEVHMLSTGAFNALLKTLEEPPVHVKFILATTEIEKVPETIRSRTLRFDFRKITTENIIARLEFVCQSENITAEKEAIELIARVARGGLRDALALLEQNTIDGEVHAEHIRYTLALIEDTLIDDIIEKLRVSDIAGILSIIENLRTGHIDARGLFEQLLYRLRDLMFEHISDARFFEYEAIFTLLMEGHSKIKLIPDGMMLIEITFLKIVKRGEKISIPPVRFGSDQKQGNGGSGVETVGAKKKIEKGGAEPEGASFLTTDAFGTFGNKSTESESMDSGTSQKGEKSGDAGLLREARNDDTEKQQSANNASSTQSFSFPALIAHFRTENAALMTDLKTARFQIQDNNTLLLIFSKSWNHGRVDTPKIKNTITEALEKLFGGSWKMETRLEEGGMASLNVDDVF